MSETPEIGGGRYETGFSAAQEYSRLDADFPAKIEKSDIKPHAIKAGETEIIAQRHGDYVRDRSDKSVGNLTPEAAEDVSSIAEGYFSKFLSEIPEDERDSVDVLFVSSDTQYFGGGRRSLETGDLALQAAEKVYEEMGLSLDNIHNRRGKLKGMEDKSGPRPMASMREPQFLDQNPDFAGYLLDKYSQTEGPDGQKKIDVPFWVAFETDIEADLRSQMGAEGPDDIADRMARSVNVLARYAQAYHKLNPGRRLVIWASTHYDTISPYVRRDIFKQDDYKQEALGVELGGGMTIDIDQNGRAVTELGRKTYEVPVRPSGKQTDSPGN